MIKATLVAYHYCLLAEAGTNPVMWNTSERGILCKVGLYIICDSLIAEKGAFSQHTAVWRGSASFFCALAMSHAWTRLLPSDVSWLTIEWQQSWTHTANAATIASCEAAQRYVGMAHCVGRPCVDGKKERRRARQPPEKEEFTRPWG